MPSDRATVVGLGWWEGNAGTGAGKAKGEGRMQARLGGGLAGGGDSLS